MRFINNPDGLAEIRLSRQTNTYIALYDNRHHQFLHDPDGRWYTVCLDHATVCSHDTRVLAIEWMGDPVGWCEVCGEFARAEDDPVFTPSLEDWYATNHEDTKQMLASLAKRAKR